MLTMGPVPEDNPKTPADRDLPDSSDSEELDMPSDIVPPAPHSSSDEDDDGDSEEEGLTNDGYMLLPQHPEEEGDEGDETFPSQALPSLSSLEREAVCSESMTEVRGAGVDLSQAVAEGNVHPAFAASFPHNKVLALPKAKKEDMLWNHAAAEADRLHLDSAQLSKVKSAMSGFQLPTANIPDWAQHISDDEWKQHLVNRLSPAEPSTASQTFAAGANKVKKDVASTEHSEGGKN